MKQFLELFTPYPGNHYMVVSTGFDEVSFELCKLVERVDGEFSIAIYGKKQDTPKELNKATIKYVDDFSKPYRAMPRSNDVIVLKDIYSIHKNKDMLIKIAYTSLANSAEIVLMEKKRILDIEKTKEHLQDLEFRASNYLDILDGYDIITARKMHMWGNGL